MWPGQATAAQRTGVGRAAGASCRTGAGGATSIAGRLQTLGPPAHARARLLVVVGLVGVAGGVGDVHVGLQLRGGQQRRHDQAQVRQELLAQALAQPRAGLQHVAAGRVVGVQLLRLRARGRARRLAAARRGLPGSRQHVLPSHALAPVPAAVWPCFGAGAAPCDVGNPPAHLRQRRSRRALAALPAREQGACRHPAGALLGPCRGRARAPAWAARRRSVRGLRARGGTCSACMSCMTRAASSRKRARPTDMPTRLMHSSALARSSACGRSVAFSRMWRSSGITCAAASRAAALSCAAHAPTARLPAQTPRMRPRHSCTARVGTGRAAPQAGAAAPAAGWLAPGDAGSRARSRRPVHARAGRRTWS